MTQLSSRGRRAKLSTEEPLAAPVCWSTWFRLEAHHFVEGLDVPAANLRILPLQPLQEDQQPRPPELWSEHDEGLAVKGIRQREHQLRVAVTAADLAEGIPEHAAEPTHLLRRRQVAVQGFGELPSSLLHGGSEDQ